MSTEQRGDWPPSPEQIEPWTARHGQRRQIWIYDADRLVHEAYELSDQGVAHAYSDKQAKAVRKAARLYMKSAAFYKQAGLGIQAITSYQDAADCYARVGDDDACEHAEEQAASIEEFWDSDADEPEGL